jgi:hypothetical protein
MNNEKPIDETSDYETAGDTGKNSDEKVTPEKPRIEGVIGRCIAERGFGFIHREGGKDVFFMWIVLAWNHLRLNLKMGNYKEQRCLLW